MPYLRWLWSKRCPLVVSFSVVFGGIRLWILRLTSLIVAKINNQGKTTEIRDRGPGLADSLLRLPYSKLQPGAWPGQTDSRNEEP